MTMEKMSDDSVAPDVDMEEDVIRADSDDDVTAAEPLTSAADNSNFVKGSHLTLKEQARQLVINVREYFRRERDNRGPLINTDLVLERTCAALKLPPGVVIRVTRPVYHLNSNGGTGRSDFASRLHPLRIDAIKNFVEMYYRTDSSASMTKAYEKIVRSGLFTGSHTTLRRLLQKEGFEFVRGKRRCDTFKRVKSEFIFEDCMSKKEDKETDSKDEEKTTEDGASKLEPHDSLKCERDDLEFFRSVLPSVAKLNDQDKLNFRMAVMTKMHALLYQPQLSS
uniref:DNA polymerase IV n=3 Tax=Lygus hesperus TaxID=30085 RepID=A0A0A9Z0L2_LYGHE